MFKEVSMNSDELQKFKSERYANQLVRNAFPDVRNVEKHEEWNKYAQDIYQQLKVGLEAVFNEALPISERCPICGKMLKEPRKELLSLELAERFYEAYRSLGSRLPDPPLPAFIGLAKTPDETAVPWAQVPVENRIMMIEICGELLRGCVVLTAKEESKP